MTVEALQELIKGTVSFHFSANDSHSVDDMINTTKKANVFPEVLEAEIKALESPSRTKGEAVMLADERDHWKVQVSFAKDWILTLTIKKEGINKEGKDVSVHFCNPCSYKGYPLFVNNDRVWFPRFKPTYCQSDVGWSLAEFPDEGDNRSWISIDLTDKNNDIIGLIQVYLDELFTALASSETNKAETNEAETNEAETAEAETNETKPLLVDPVDGMTAMRNLDNSPFPPEEKIYRLDLVMEHLLKSPLLTAVDCNNLIRHINHSSVYTLEQKNDRTDRVLERLLNVRFRDEASADDEPSPKRTRRNM
jgi:hypothetical protein